VQNSKFYGLTPEGRQTKSDLVKRPREIAIVEENSKNKLPD